MPRPSCTADSLRRAWYPCEPLSRPCRMPDRRFRSDLRRVDEPAERSPQHPRKSNLQRTAGERRVSNRPTGEAVRPSGRRVYARAMRWLRWLPIAAALHAAAIGIAARMLAPASEAKGVLPVVLVDRPTVRAARPREATVAAPSGLVPSQRRARAPHPLPARRESAPATIAPAPTAPGPPPIAPAAAAPVAVPSAPPVTHAGAGVGAAAGGAGSGAGPGSSSAATGAGGGRGGGGAATGSGGGAGEDPCARLSRFVPQIRARVRYPAIALRAGVEGTVVLAVRTGGDGAPTVEVIESADPLLDDAAR